MTLRALFGGELRGQELVRMAFLDEAGVGDIKQEPFLVVAGVLVHGDYQLSKLVDELKQVVANHIPEELRDGLILHASDIYGGNGKIFDKKRHPEWTAERRMAILNDMAEIPNRANIQVISGWAERANFPQTFTLGPGERPDLTAEAQVCAFMSCILEADLWLREHAKGEHCLVIVENTDRAKRLIADTQDYHQNRARMGTLIPEHAKYFPLERIWDEPAFQKKNPAHPLVMADFVAFVMKRFLMKDPWISPYYDPWRKRHACLAIENLQRR